MSLWHVTIAEDLNEIRGKTFKSYTHICELLSRRLKFHHVWANMSKQEIFGKNDVIFGKLHICDTQEMDAGVISNKRFMFLSE